MPQNDWIVARINNPNFTVADFKNIADLSTSNTQLLSREDYLKSDFIRNQDMFKDETGKFSEQIFTDFYNQGALSFGELQTGEFYDGPALDMFDIMRTPNARIQDIHFSIGRGYNPDRQAIGIEGVNVWSDPEFSKREIAKQNKVYNYERGEFEDFSINDHTLVTSIKDWWKDLIGQPYVMATYDEEGDHIDPITGALVHHQKGEYRLNDKGTYFYETLGNRSILGKDVLSTLDTFTIDGQGLNKYDFFDSNDIKKSVAGSIAKNVVSLLPLFCGPIVGGIYGGAMVIKELSKSMPMAYGIITAFSDAETPEWMNSLAATATKLSSSTSDYAQEHTFAWENFANLVADVALQWQQQKFIASAFSNFKTPNKYLQEARENALALYNSKKATLGESKELLDACMAKFITPAEKMAKKSAAVGRDLSLAYMSIVSNSDVYGDMLEAGATKTEAAAVAFGSTMGMFLFDKFSGLGEIFLDDATPNSVKMARKALKTEFAEAQGTFKQIIKTEPNSKRKFAKLIAKGAEKSKKAVSQFWEDVKYHSLSGLGKAVGEGLEEVGEELITDMSKSLYELAGSLGFNTAVRDVGAWDNALERYTMSLFGGMIGGGIFYGKEVFDSGNFHRPVKVDQDMASLVRNGYADDLRAQAVKMYDENHTGSKTLSASEYETDENGKLTAWRTVTDVKKSQARAVLDQVLDKINSLEAVLTNSRVGLTDEQLFDNMVLTEQRYNRYKEIAPITNYYQDYATVLQGLIQAELDLRAAFDTLEGTPDGTKIPTDTALNKLTQEQKDARTQSINNLKQKVADARTKVEDFLSGNTSLDYTRKLNFALDPALHRQFLDVSEDEFFETKLQGRDIKDLEPKEIAEIYKEYIDYTQTQLKTKLGVIWDRFKQVEREVNPHLHILKDNADSYKATHETLKELLKGDLLDYSKVAQNLANWDTKLDNETDDEYNGRNTKAIDATTGQEEDDASFRARRLIRQQKIDDYNMTHVYQEWVDRLDAELQKVHYKVDPVIARQIKAAVSQPGRLRERLQYWLSKLQLRDVELSLSDGSPDTLEVDNLHLFPLSVLRELALDLSNKDDVLDKFRSQMVGAYSEAANNTVKEALSKTDDITVTDLKEDGEVVLDDEGNPVTRRIRFSDYFTTADSEGNLDLGQHKTLQEILNMLLDDDVKLETIQKDSAGNSYTLSDDQKIHLQKIIQTVEHIAGGDALDTLTLDRLQDGISSYLVTESRRFDTAIESQMSILGNEVTSLTEGFSREPLVQFQQKLDDSLKNPLTEFLEAVAAAHGDTLPNAEKILQSLQFQFDNLDNAIDLFVNDTQREEMMKVHKYLSYVKAYFHAASATPNNKTIFGHNQTINEFAESHASTLRTPWNALPTLPPDVAAMYAMEATKYQRELMRWIDISDRNQIFTVEIERATNQRVGTVLFKALQEKLKEFTINGHTYNPLAGVSTIDISQLDSDEALLAVYNLERLIYKNIYDAAKAENLTVSELIKKHKLLEQLLPTTKNIDNKKTARLRATMATEEFTDFDTVKYVLTILSSDPAVFYEDYKQRVAASPKIAPVLGQELGARIGRASFTEVFREGFKYVYDQLPAVRRETPFAANTTILFGVGGAGKTQVVLNAIDSMIKDKPVLIAAPKINQAQTLAKALSRTNSTTIAELLDMILGEELHTKIKTEFNQLKGDSFVGEYIEKKTGTDQFTKVNITDKVVFQKLTEIPSAIYIDEATHLTTVEALILSKYAESVGAQLVLAGDPLQRGYNNGTSAVANIDEGAIWAATLPRLMQSYRYDNLQKYQNQIAVQAAIEALNDIRLNDSKAEFDAAFGHYLNMASKFNFKLYNGDELNGEMLTKTLDNATLQKLKAAQAAGKSIGFIGSGTSAVLNQLKAAGITFADDHVLSLDQMQGQEFDFTVIDYTPPLQVNNTGNLRKFLQDIYTLMTRSRTASIFIDNGLSPLIGKQSISKNKSKAPGFATEMIDERTGRKATGAQILQQARLELLAKYDLTPLVIGAPATPPPATQQQGQQQAPQPAQQQAQSQSQPQAQPQPQQQAPPQSQPQTQSQAQQQAPPAPPVQQPDPNTQPPSTLPNEFVDPTAQVLSQDDQDAIERFLEAADEDAGDTDSDASAIATNYEAGKFLVESYGESTPLGVQVSTEEEEWKGANGTIRKSRSWTVTPPTEGPLRNLQAIADPKGEKALSYSEKITMQRRLAKVKAAILYGAAWPGRTNPSSLPQDIILKFNKADWLNGTFELEFRPADEHDSLAIWAGRGTMENGFEYRTGEGKITANIVYVVKNKKGQICRFDIAGINNPETLNKNKQKIKAALAEKIVKAQAKGDTQLEEKLNGLLEKFDTDVLAYTTWFNTQYEQFKKIMADGNVTDKTFTVNVTSAIRLNKTTILEKRSTPVRLGGWINPDIIESWKRDKNEDPQNINDTNSLMEMSPDVVFSQVYTFTGHEDEAVENIDPTLAGKAVIFVSNNTLLKPEDLLGRYLKQKKAPSSHTPEVRMVILDAYGVSLSQMTSRNFVSRTASADAENLPFQKNFMGVRMFVSLWNHRASLMKFMEAYKAWRTRTGFTDEQITALLEAYQMQFDGASDPDINKKIEKRLNLANQPGLRKLTLESLDLVTEFNEKDCKDIPTYRLGASRKNDFHIQRFNVKGSTAYNPDIEEANLLVITPDKAKQFFNMVDSLLDVIIPPAELTAIADGVTLNLDFVEVDDHGNEIGRWAKDKWIDIENAAHRRSVANIMDNSDKEMIKIKDGPGDKDQVIAYTKGNLWSLIPSVVTGFYRTILGIQENPEALENEKYQVVTISYKTPNSTETDFQELNIPVTQFFGQDGWLSTANEEIDRSFSQMLDLMFHGTVEDIHGYETKMVDGQMVKTKRDFNTNPLMQLEDAYFKKGFYIHPDIFVKKRGGGYFKGAVKGQTEEIFFEIATPHYWLTADVGVRSASCQLSLAELLNPSTVKPTQTQGPTTAPEVGPAKPNMSPVEAEMRKYLTEHGHTIIEGTSISDAFDKACQADILQAIRDNNGLITEEMLNRYWGYINMDSGEVLWTIKDMLEVGPTADYTLQDGYLVIADRAFTLGINKHGALGVIPHHQLEVKPTTESPKPNQNSEGSIDETTSVEYSWNQGLYDGPNGKATLEDIIAYYTVPEVISELRSNPDNSDITSSFEDNTDYMIEQLTRLQEATTVEDKDNRVSQIRNDQRGIAFLTAVTRLHPDLFNPLILGC